MFIKVGQNFDTYLFFHSNCNSDFNINFSNVHKLFETRNTNLVKDKDSFGFVGGVLIGLIDVFQAILVARKINIPFHPKAIPCWFTPLPFCPLDKAKTMKKQKIIE